MVGPRPSGLEQRLQPDEVGVHPALGVPSEDPGDRVPEEARRRAVAHVDLDARAAAVGLGEMHGALVLDGLVGQRPPRDRAVRLPLRDLRLEVQRPARDGLDGPRAAIAVGVDVEDVLHELGEVLELVPQRVHALDRSADRDRLLDTDLGAPRQRFVRRAAHDQRGTGGGHGRAGETTSYDAVEPGDTSRGDRRDAQRWSPRLAVAQLQPVMRETLGAMAGVAQRLSEKRLLDTPHVGRGLRDTRTPPAAAVGIEEVHQCGAEGARR